MKMEEMKMEKNNAEELVLQIVNWCRYPFDTIVH
jgi:hypothetical protein